MPKRNARRRQKFSRLQAAHAASRGFAMPRVPVRWVNAVIGLFLLPVAGIWTQTFFTCFYLATLKHGFWATEEFWFFTLGVVLWLIAFFGLPRPVLIYVFGHELTHAIWVWVMGGRVSKFEVTSRGGHIITDTHNFWIALAPYFFPLYSVLVIVGYGVGSLFHDLSAYREILYALIGATWGFHITFTLWMIPNGQTDLTYHNTFFSLVVIYLMNLIVLTIFLLLTAPHVGAMSFGNGLFENTMNFAAWVSTEIDRLVNGLLEIRRSAG